MPSTRCGSRRPLSKPGALRLAAIGLFIVTSACSGGSSGGSTGTKAEDPPSIPLEVVKVTTITTVQTSAGSYLVAQPEQALPPNVERSRTLAGSAQQRRAELDSAVLFRSIEPVSAGLTLSGAPRLSAGSAWAVDWGFPALGADGGAGGPIWRLRFDARSASGAPATVEPASSEWQGWTLYDGLSVRSASDSSATTPGAPAALLNASASGVFAPLELGSEGTDVVIKNPSDRVISRALLIYSHSGGVGVREVLDLGPGERRVTTLGPKERPPMELLERGRDELTAFFAERVGDELGRAIATSKSIPFLESHGLRLVYMLEQRDAPVSIEFSARLAQTEEIVVAHQEVLSLADEASVTSLLEQEQAPTLTDVTAALGRFTQAKLEFATLDVQSRAATRAQALLNELRTR